MKKASKTRLSGSVKVGVVCPACADEIFSFYPSDFRRCSCGKVFIDGGDEQMRFGAESPVAVENIRHAYRPLRMAEKMMSKAGRGAHAMLPPPKSYRMVRNKYQLVFNWEIGLWSWGYAGAYPASGKFKGSIYQWIINIGPVEIRRWAE